MPVGEVPYTVDWSNIEATLHCALTYECSNLNAAGYEFLEAETDSISAATALKILSLQSRFGSDLGHSTCVTWIARHIGDAIMIG